MIRNNKVQTAYSVQYTTILLGLGTILVLLKTFRIGNYTISNPLKITYEYFSS